MKRNDFFGMGFEHRNFDCSEREKIFDEWNKMSDSEKLEIMNRRMNSFKEKKGHGDHFSVEHIDARCEEWMKKTPEEKEVFVAERKKAFEERHAMMHEHFSHHGFGFGFHGRGRSHNQPEEKE